jgi:transcription elongation GreA/GreB family factor
MSKAFTNEDALPPDDAESLPPRQGRLPITPAGYARLQEELATITRAHPASRSDMSVRRARVLVQILKSVYVVEPAGGDGRAAFGARVTVAEDSGCTRTYHLVGPDEADLAAGQISAASPVAQALVGKRAGDRVVLRRPKGDVEVTVVSVSPGD